MAIGCSKTCPALPLASGFSLNVSPPKSPTKMNQPLHVKPEFKEVLQFSQRSLFSHNAGPRDWSFCRLELSGTSFNLKPDSEEACRKLCDNNQCTSDIFWSLLQLGGCGESPSLSSPGCVAALSALSAFSFFLSAQGDILASAGSWGLFLEVLAERRGPFLGLLGLPGFRGSGTPAGMSSKAGTPRVPRWDVCDVFLCFAAPFLFFSPFSSFSPLSAFSPLSLLSSFWPFCFGSFSSICLFVRDDDRDDRCELSTLGRSKEVWSDIHMQKRHEINSMHACAYMSALHCRRQVAALCQQLWKNRGACQNLFNRFSSSSSLFWENIET